MCEYCDCLEITPIAQLAADHELLLDLRHEIKAALRAGDERTARGLFARLVAILDPHDDVEERGLFAVLHDEPEFTTYIDGLTREHVRLHERIAKLPAAGPRWPEEAVAILDTLAVQIHREEDGLYPATVATLDGEQWAAVAAARNI